jgi:hypothetical protein
MGALQTTATLKQYYATCLALVSIIILFGGLVAPVVSLSVPSLCAWQVLFTRYLDFIYVSLIDQTLTLDFCAFECVLKLLRSSWS